ncbi:MAG: peptidoglycan DD-metalloendopeptidase family protein [Desulfuromusa sp.]|nr:peptidoglycan DD-metalloendopeptidase family protein [Desulfuromusa sp.]
MNAIWKPTSAQLKSRRHNRRLLLLALVTFILSVGLYYQWKPTSPAVPTPETATTEENTTDSISAPLVDKTEAAEEGPIRVRTIKPGDNLSALFDSVKIGQTTMLEVLAADESLLALDILRPSNTLTFTVSQENSKLQTLELLIHPGHQVIYRRVTDDSFEYEEVIREGQWKEQQLCGDIEGSFYLSALAAGLTEQETGNITELFNSQLNFVRDIRAGDHFQVIRKLQLVDGGLTGKSYIKGVRIFARKHYYNAFLFEDGNYYDERGESLANAFRRYPYKGRYRVSSSFSPRRRHPITGRISPHKGVDFAMPTGTVVLATGDGEITRVKNHPFAGKYIEIRHDGRYKTRYLHLGRIKVRCGQRVKRGEDIALSGNTGRSTGPHLHYELHVNGRVVNPLTAKIPMATAIPKNKLASFKSQMNADIALMEQPRPSLPGS